MANGRRALGNRFCPIKLVPRRPRGFCDVIGMNAKIRDSDWSVCTTWSKYSILIGYTLYRHTITTGFLKWLLTSCTSCSSWSTTFFNWFSVSSDDLQISTTRFKSRSLSLERRFLTTLLQMPHTIQSLAACTVLWQRRQFLWSLLAHSCWTDVAWSSRSFWLKKSK